MQQKKRAKRDFQAEGLNFFWNEWERLIQVELYVHSCDSHIKSTYYINSKGRRTCIYILLHTLNGMAYDCNVIAMLRNSTQSKQYVFVRNNFVFYQVSRDCGTQTLLKCNQYIRALQFIWKLQSSITSLKYFQINAIVLLNKSSTRLLFNCHWLIAIEYMDSNQTPPHPIHIWIIERKLINFNGGFLIRSRFVVKSNLMAWNPLGLQCRCQK